MQDFNPTSLPTQYRTEKGTGNNKEIRVIIKKTYSVGYW
jgi:hypothetical protein